MELIWFSVTFSTDTRSDMKQFYHSIFTSNNLGTYCR